MTIRQDRRRKAELEIIKDLKRVPSSREMQTLLKERYNITVNHNIINDELKKDLESLTTEKYNNLKDSLMDMLEQLQQQAFQISTNSADDRIRLDAMKTVAKLNREIAWLATLFKKANAELAIKEQPIFHVSIGQPKQIDMSKFKKMEKGENVE